MASAQSTDSLRLNPIQRTPFRVAPTFAFTPGPTSVASGDLNGDGHPDLVVTRLGSGAVSVLLGDGKGGFSTSFSYPAGTNVSNALVADFNGDGKLDVAVTDSATGSIDVLFGNGDGTLRSPVVYSGIKAPVALAAGHFTASGSVDLAVASASGLAVLLNDGTGKFASPVAVAISSQPLALAAADLRSAGHDDLLLANQDGSVSVLLGDGTGHFIAQPAIAVGSGPLSSALAVDLNADGHPDLAVTQASSNTVTVLLGRGDGTFQPGSSYAVGSGPSRVIAADLTGSGVLDLVSINQLSNTFSVLVGNGNGTFHPSVNFVAGNLPIGITAADFNGDGKADLAIANSQDQSISVPLGRGDGTFIATPFYPADLVSKAVAAGDLNGDGRTDLVAVNYCGSDAACSTNGTATIFLANADGTYRAASTLALGAGPVAVALADLHGTGKLDLIALNSVDKTLSIFAGNGDGTFSATQRYTLSASPRALLVGDFNGDGKADLAVASDCGQSACTQPGSLDIWLGRGDGSLSASASYTTGYAPVSIAAGDLRSTGHLDLVVANACGDDSTCKSAGTASIFTNDGTGKLTAAGELSIGSAPSSIAIGKLSGSGLDLAVAQSGSNQVAVYHSNGNGSFGAGVNFAVGTAPSALAIADVNHDGKLDLAVANSQSSNVSVLYGSTTGLQSAVNYPVAANPTSLVALKSGIVTANSSTAKPYGGGGVTPLGSTGTDVGSSTLAVSTASSTVNGQVTLTATVLGDGTDGAPTGTVIFAIDNGSGNTTPISDCKGDTGETLINVDTNTASVSCTTQQLPAGSLELQAQYQGDANYAPNVSADQAVSVAQTASAVTITTPPPATAAFGQSVSLTATVAPNPVAATVTDTVPFTGTMAFQSNGTNITGCSTENITFDATTGTASASCTTTALSAGADQVTASYNGDTNYTASPASSASTVTVAGAGTQVVVAAPSPASPSVDEVVTVTATVSPNPGPSSGSFKGSMAFFINGTAYSACSMQPVDPTTGVSSCQIATGLAVGSTAIKAVYSGDSIYAGSQATGSSFSVAKAGTQTSVSASPTASTADQSVTLTATVTPTVTGTAVAAANVANMTAGVSFSDGANPITSCASQSVTLSNGTGTATCITSGLAVGAHTITASYLGDSSYSVSSTNTSGSVTVSQATPSVKVTANPASPALNQSVQYTVDITFPSPLNASLVPGGTVTFSDNGTTINGCSGMSLVVSTPANVYTTATTCTEPSLTGGSHSIVASYTGDTNYSAAQYSLPLSIGTQSTTSTITASPTSSTVNGSVTFTASVKGGTATAVTGTATGVADGTTTLGQCQLAASQGGTWNSTTGIASCTFTSSALALGSHTIAINYSGDSNYASSTGSLNGNGSSFSVSAATTSLALSSSPNPSTVNTPVAFTATLTYPSGSVPLSGTVTFTDNGTTIPCSPVTPTSTGVAVCSDSGLAASATAHTIKATFTDSKNNFSTSSATLTPGQTVSAAAGTLTLSASPNPSSFNQQVTFLATLSVPSGGPGGINPSGTISFNDSVTGTAIPGCGSAALNANNVAQCVTTGLSNGNHGITAVYSTSDTNFNVSASNTVTQSVGAAATSVNISSSENPSNVNDTVNFTATVSSSAQGSNKFMGTMLFKANGTTISGCGMVAVNSTTGVSQPCSVSTLTVGPNTITAAYSGDTNFAGSSNTFVQTVNSTAGGTVVLTPATTSAIEYGTPVSFTATITPAYTGAVALSGTMVFTDVYTNQAGIQETIALCSVKAGSPGFIAQGAGAGVVNCPSVLLPDGVNNITASYSGDANFIATSSQTTTQTVTDFSVAVAPVPSTGTGILITQGTGTAASPDPYPAQPISITPTSISQYVGTLTLTCTAIPATGAPACDLASNSLSVLAAGTQTSDAITLDATSAQPGTYSFTVTATDGHNAVRTFTFPVTVRSASAPLSLVSGATTNNSTTVQFVVPANVSLPGAGNTFSCLSVVGPELSGTYTTAQLSMGCSFSPATIPTSATQQTATVTVTISTSGAVAMNQPSGRPNNQSGSLLIAGIFGIPVFGLMGLLGGRKSTRTIFLRLLAIAAIAVAGWQVMGCGGSFSGSSTTTGGKTPPGVYNILVQGTGSDGNTYQAVVKLNVTL